MEFVIKPKTYTPFKKRIKKSLKVTLILLLAMVAIGIFQTINEGASAVQNTNWFIMGTGTFGIITLSSVIAIMSQIWILDSVVFDDDKRTIKVQIRKFDGIVDKGEYPIDNNLRVWVKTRYPQTGAMKLLRIKYGRKSVWSQSNSPMAGAIDWSDNMLDSIANFTEKIRNG